MDWVAQLDFLWSDPRHFPPMWEPSPDLGPLFFDSDDTSQGSRSPSSNSGTYDRDGMENSESSTSSTMLGLDIGDPIVDTSEGDDIQQSSPSLIDVTQDEGGNSLPRAGRQLCNSLTAPTVPPVNEVCEDHIMDSVD